MAKTQRAKYQQALAAWEYPERIKLLQATWPKAFSARDALIRPLVKQGPTAAIMAAFGWTGDYATGVLKRWKSRHAYARAVLRYPKYINIDGSFSEEMIDDVARERAKQQLANPEPVPVEPVAPPEGPPAPPAAAGNTRIKKAEQLRGLRAALEHIPALREKWPAAFPEDGRKVRPLMTAHMQIAEAMGWTPGFAHGVVAAWKSRVAYCKAVLRHDERIKLDGSPSGVKVDDTARALATQRLAQIAARNAAKQAEEAAASLLSALEPAAVQVPDAPVVIGPPVTALPEPEAEAAPQVIKTAEQLRAHLRGSLLKRRPPAPPPSTPPR
jgi:sRNA-binding protein